MASPIFLDGDKAASMNTNFLGFRQQVTSKLQTLEPSHMLYI